MGSGGGGGGGGCRGQTPRTALALAGAGTMQELVNYHTSREADSQCSDDLVLCGVWPR